MEVFSFYVVDDEALPQDLQTLSDEEKYNVLVAAIESEGVFNTALEMVADDFVDSLEALDEYLEGDRLLPNRAMNNSPNDVLGKDAECPYMGFFDNGDAQRVYNMLDKLPEEVVDTIESSENHSEVYHTLLAATLAAVDAGCGLAIIHT